MGRNGSDEVKLHRFFKTSTWSWDNLRQSDAPIVPELKSDIDTQYFDTIDEGDKAETFDAPRVSVGGREGGREGEGGRGGKERRRELCHVYQSLNHLWLGTGDSSHALHSTQPVERDE